MKTLDYGQKTKQRIIQFDSSATMLKSLAQFLYNKDFAGLGVAEGIPDWVARAINKIPKDIRRSLYAWSGWFNAIKTGDISGLMDEDISRWAISLYPQKLYNGVMFGSSNGAAVHICAALGIPWIPQTYLVAMPRLMHPDEIKRDILWGREKLKKFLRNNPDIRAFQMHDPVQDRLMVGKMGYFRIKHGRLTKTFKNFICSQVSKGSPFFTLECNYKWPMQKLSENHYFQLGGFGALDGYEYLNSSPRVSEFLKQSGSSARRWQELDITDEPPEAEWGFWPESLEDIKKLVKKSSLKLVRIIFDHPEGLSEFSAELYKYWYKKRGRSFNTLIIENFCFVAPFDAIETNAVPFWLAFNTDNSVKRIRSYLQNQKAFDRIFLMLMSNGVSQGIGLANIDEWKRLLKTAQQEGSFIGTDEAEYPLDFGSFIKYHSDLKKKIRHRQAFPAALTFKELMDFAANNGKKFNVEFKA